MTLIERASRLGKAAQRLQHLKQAETDAETFASRQTQLLAKMEALRPLMDSFHLLRQSCIPLSTEDGPGPGLATGLPPRTAGWAARMQGLLDRTLEEYRRNPQAIRTLGGNQQLLGEMDRFIEQLDTTLKTAWRRHAAQYVAEHGVKVNEAVLRELERVGTLRGAVQRVRQRLAAVSTWEARLPRTEADLTRFQEDVRQLTEAWSDVGGGGGLPEPVLQFLRQAGAPDGAPLSLLTEDVRTHLQRMGILDSFRIRARATGYVG